MLLLNLGCGTKTSPLCVNIDWSIHLRLKKSKIGSQLARSGLLRGERLERFNRLSDNLVVHDLRKGIPVQDGSADAVYHSHVLEHIDREAVPRFLAEILRVLKPGGVHRIVVPDFEELCRRYLTHLLACASDPNLRVDHDRYVGDIVFQMVMREAPGTSQQPPVRRFVENLLLGSAQRRGQTHRWMYDYVNLSDVLLRAGFRHITRHSFQTSGIPTWTDIGLDQDAEGGEYKPGSLYVEAIK